MSLPTDAIITGISSAAVVLPQGLFIVQENGLESQTTTRVAPTE